MIGPMSGLFKIVLVYVWSSFQARERLKAEIIVLRHQLNILSRKVPKRPGLSGGDRAILAVSSFSADCGCHHRCAAGIDRWLASSGLESLVALEVSQSWRSTEDRSRATRSDPAKFVRRIRSGALRAFVVSYSSLGLTSLRRLSRNTWFVTEGRLRKGGRHFCAAMPSSRFPRRSHNYV